MVVAAILKIREVAISPLWMNLFRENFGMVICLNPPDLLSIYNFMLLTIQHGDQLQSDTRSSTIAEGLRDAIVSRNPATTKIPFENYCNQQMTFKFIRLRSSQLLLLVRPLFSLVSGLLLQCLYLAPFLRYYHF